jgi:hypothetical protein
MKLVFDKGGNQNESKRHHSGVTNPLNSSTES